MKKQSVKKGIFIMTLTNFINKFIGMIYNIILVYLLTTKGVGLLNNALNIYTTLVVGFTAGFSAALAKIISENVSLGRYKYAHRVFKISFYIFVAVGVLSGILMYLISMYMAVDSDVHYSIYALIPALFLVALSTIFRGYFQGMRYMTPIAVAQFGDQLAKIIIGTTLVIRFMPDLKLAAFGAAVGFTCGAFVSLCIMVFMYLNIRRNIHFNMEFQNTTDSSDELVKTIVKQTLMYAIPISLGGTIIQTIGVVDQFVINKLLPTIGYDLEQAKLFYGIYTGQAMKLIDIPSVLTVAVAVNMLPAISSAYASKSFGEIKAKTLNAYRLVSLIAIPAAFGMSTLAKPIIMFIFRNEGNDIGGLILQILALAVIFISFIQISASVLQGLNKIYAPIKNITVGFIVKISISLLVFKFPEHLIAIIAGGTVVCYMIASILNVNEIKKLTGIKNREFKFIYVIIMNSMIMSIFVALFYNNMIRMLNSNSIVLILSIIFGIALYFALSYAFKVIKPEEINLLKAKNRR